MVQLLVFLRIKTDVTMWHTYALALHTVKCDTVRDMEESLTCKHNECLCTASIVHGTSGYVLHAQSIPRQTVTSGRNVTREGAESFSAVSSKKRNTHIIGKHIRLIMI